MNQPSAREWRAYGPDERLNVFLEWCAAEAKHEPPSNWRAGYHAALNDIRHFVINGDPLPDMEPDLEYEAAQAAEMESERQQAGEAQGAWMYGLRNGGWE